MSPKSTIPISRDAWHRLFGGKTSGLLFLFTMFGFMLRIFGPKNIGSS